VLVASVEGSNLSFQLSGHVLAAVLDVPLRQQKLVRALRKI
jgi:hypothetical protein